MEFQVICYFAANEFTSFSMYGVSLAHVNELFESTLNDPHIFREGMLLNDGTMIDVKRIIAYNIQPVARLF